jgi:hypothetical protein
MLRNKILWYAVGALVLFYVVSDPAGAAVTGRSAIAGLGAIGNGVIAFFTALSAN